MICSICTFTARTADIIGKIIVKKTFIEIREFHLVFRLTLLFSSFLKQFVYFFKFSIDISRLVIVADPHSSGSELSCRIQPGSSYRKL